jgi:hypothetical protein
VKLAWVPSARYCTRGATSPILMCSSIGRTGS